MQPINRRSFLTTLSAAALVAGASRRGFAQESPAEPKIVWYDVREWGVEGKGWSDTEKYFDRFPARAKETLRPAVWGLSRHSAGMMVRFRTDATTIFGDLTVTSPSLAMPHMPATAVSGLDLYAEDDAGSLQWLAVTMPKAQTTTGPIISDIVPGPRNFAIYLPLYNGTESLKIGVPQGASFEPIAPRTEKPIVFYGTSITHGACASRPGMPHPAILGRRLNLPVINLGFSGNGKMEPAVTNLLTEIDAATYVIDCLPNMTPQEVAERTQPLVQTLRKAKPETPILLVEDRTFSNAWLVPSKQEAHAARRKALRTAYEALTKSGIGKLYYLEGEKLLADAEHNDTTDGSHPSDLGFWRHANAFEPVLREMLGKA